MSELEQNVSNYSYQHKIYVLWPIADNLHLDKLAKLRRCIYKPGKLQVGKFGPVPSELLTWICLVISKSPPPIFLLNCIHPKSEKKNRQPRKVGGKSAQISTINDLKDFVTKGR